MKWLRLYHDLPNDPKWRLIAMDSEQPLTAVIAVYISMLCCASAAEERGTLEGWDDRTAGAALNLKGDAVRSIREAMQGIVLDGDRLTGWDKRQRQADDTATRTANYRKRLHEGTGRKSTPYVAADIIALDGGACIYCGATAKLCVDHMVPIICGGDHEQDNLACACRRCNSGKSGRTPEQARYEIISPAAKARYMHAVARLGINPHTVKAVAPDEPRSPLTGTTGPLDVTVTSVPVTVTGSHVTVTSVPVTEIPLRAKTTDTEGSVASATGTDVPAAVPLKTELFGRCLVWLVASSGRPEKSLRPMVGRWIGKHGEGAVLAAIVQAQREAAVSPVGFIEAVLKSGSGDHGKANGSKHERLVNGFARAFGDLLDPGSENSSGDRRQLTHGYH